MIARRRCDHDVGGFEIAVHDARVVRGRAPAATCRAMRHDLGHCQPPRFPQDAGEVVALDERHRDVLDALDLAEVVDAHDVLVRDLPRQQQFLLESPLDVARGRRIPGDFRPDRPSRHHHAELASHA